MPTKKALLQQLSVRKLKAIAKENRVILVVEHFWENYTATEKWEIVEILNKSRKVSKKKVEDVVFSSSKRTTSRKGKSSKATKPKRRRLAKAEKTLILKSQNFKCADCKRDISKITPHYDHRIPLGMGGSDTITNIQALCGTCHTEKTKKDRLEISRANR